MPSGIVGLPPKSLEAAPDTSGLNPGNLTTEFDPSVIAVNVPWFELYHMIVEGVPAPTPCTIKVGKLYTYSVTTFGESGIGEWDPAQPLLLQPSQIVYFLWTGLAETVEPVPVVTLWFRYNAEDWGRRNV